MSLLGYDLIRFLWRQRSFSSRTFGPGDRTKGISQHIRKELDEIAAAPAEDVLEEWIDVVILALDQCWRLGHTPGDICEALEKKYQRNMRRKWPDWRTKSPDEPIEHDRRYDPKITFDEMTKDTPYEK